MRVRNTEEKNHAQDTQASLTLLADWYEPEMIAAGMEVMRERETVVKS